MADHTKRPAKPRPDFPLFAHTRGYWCKKVGGRQVAFTRWADDPHGILAERMWNEQGDRIRGGLPPVHPDDESNAQIATIFNAFLEAREGEISEREWCAYRDIGRRVCGVLGADISIPQLVAPDFRRLRKQLANGANPVTLKGRIRRVRTVFRWALRDGILEGEPKYGAAFDPPTQADIRRARAGRVENVFAADEIRAMLDVADPVRRCWLLLALNAGFGNRDISDLRWSHLEQRSGWVIFPRPKTGIERLAPLWPETAAALTALPRNGSGDRVFVSARGNPLVFETATVNAIARRDGVGVAFGKLMEKAKLPRNGRGFYGLRASFATVATGVGDTMGVKLVMGHSRGDDITARYVRLVGETKDDRLRRIVDCVREWVFAGGEGGVMVPTHEPYTIATSPNPAWLAQFRRRPSFAEAMARNTINCLGGWMYTGDESCIFVPGHGWGTLDALRLLAAYAIADHPGVNAGPWLELAHLIEFHREPSVCLPAHAAAVRELELLAAACAASPGDDEDPEWRPASAEAGDKARLDDAEVEVLPPGLTAVDRDVLVTMASFDARDLLSIARIVECMPPTERRSDESVRTSVKKLIVANLAERPQGRNSGARLTLPGRRRAGKIGERMGS